MPDDPVALSDVHRDRAVGALLGTAAGDALAGAGGDRPPGRWTAPTAMAIGVAEFASAGAALAEQIWQDRIVERWAWWARTTGEAGPQTAAVLSVTAEPTAAAVRQSAAALYGRYGRTLDGSCLTLAVPAALRGGDADGLCGLTHGGPDATEAFGLWRDAIARAVSTGCLDVRIGLGGIDAERRDLWASRIEEAEQSRPVDFAGADDAVVATFQAAWSAIAATPEPADDPASGVFAADRLRGALRAAASCGGDVHSVAAAAGGLLGAAYGASAIPADWRQDLKGWPGLNTHLLAALAHKIVNRGQALRLPGLDLWGERPAPQRHPHDTAVWIGEAARITRLPGGATAVVSLCPVADEHIPAGVTHLEVALIDEVGANPNLDFVLLDTVRAIEQLRAGGARVFLHGLRTASRAPAVAALYGARRAGISIEQALAEVCAVLPGADPNPDFQASLRRLRPSTEGTPR